MTDKIEFTKEAIIKYLDYVIEFWREQRRLDPTKRNGSLKTSEIACYIDAYQSVRTSIFGEIKQ